MSALLRPVADTGDRPATRRRLPRGTRPRGAAVGLVLLAVGLLGFAASITVGDFPVPLRSVPGAVLGTGPDDVVFIVRELRLPRALTAVLVGAAFGVSGAIFQGLARNPLASPDIIGITAGSSAAAVFLIVVAQATGTALALGALAGGLLTAVAIYLLAWRRGVASARLILVGIGVSAVLSAVTSYLLTRAEIYEAQQATVWLTGSLNARGWDHVRPVGLALLVLVPTALVLTRHLRVLQLGDDTARALGARVEQARLGLVLVAVGLASVATAAAGPVAFVAFVSAPIARRLVRTPLTIVPAGLVGAVLVVLADLLARRAVAPTELPVGVVTGLVGAPYLIWLLARSHRIGSGG
ncbi:FecCD family ABC transporter permease [Nocardioides sp.]|uniref:FecCD family ABC transporter permease n=1 Tax=Nocardioides sp. TaxID=35761 RepID=UPI0035162EC2